MKREIDLKDFTQKLERGLFCLYILWKARTQQISGSDLSELESKHGHMVSAGRLYPTLHNLTKRGYLAMEEVNEHGKIHKYYRTTDEGRKLLNKVRGELGEPMKDFLSEWIGKFFYNIEVGEKKKEYYTESEDFVMSMVKDDILRVSAEENSSKVPLKLINSKIKASGDFIAAAGRQLEKEGLIRLEDGYVILVKKGQKKVGKILKKHSILEDYFKEKRDEIDAHKEADFLEHYISEEALNNVKKLSTFEGCSKELGEFGIGRDCLIVDVEFSVGGLFERMVSMGIYPGEKVRIMYSTPDGFVIDINNKKIAIGKDIARGIKVVEYAKY
jgi:DNA-binding PadR family transcriptional regulator/Fe2+ transport system protein FeoA